MTQCVTWETIDVAMTEAVAVYQATILAAYAKQQ